MVLKKIQRVLTYRPRKVERKSDRMVVSTHVIILKIDRTVVEGIGNHFPECARWTRVYIGLVVLQTDPKKCLTFFTTYLIVILFGYSTSTTVADRVTT